MGIPELLHAAAEWWKWIIAAICVSVMLLNDKGSLRAIFAEQAKVLRNNKTRKTDMLDWLGFLVCPIALAALIVYGFGFVIDSRLAEALTTAFSFIFTLLVACEAMLSNKNGNEKAMPADKNGSNDALRLEVAKQTFVSIITASLFSLTADILSIFIMFVTHAAAVAVLTACVLALSFMIVMLLLLIVKRTFKLYMSDKR